MEILFQEIIFGLNIIQILVIGLIGYLLFPKYPLFISGVVLCYGGLTFLGGLAILISLILGVFGMFGKVLGFGKKRTSKSRR